MKRYKLDIPTIMVGRDLKRQVTIKLMEKSCKIFDSSNYCKWISLAVDITKYLRNQIKKAITKSWCFRTNYYNGIYGME